MCRLFTKSYLLKFSGKSPCYFRSGLFVAFLETVLFHLYVHLEFNHASNKESFKT